MCGMIHGLDAPCYGLFMIRRRWPDVVIVVAILAIGATGTMAIWGKQIKQMMGSDSAEEDPAPTPSKSTGPLL
jgi:hypothetical protein